MRHCYLVSAAAFAALGLAVLLAGIGGALPTRAGFVMASDAMTCDPAPFVDIKRCVGGLGLIPAPACPANECERVTFTRCRLPNVPSWIAVPEAFDRVPCLDVQQKGG